MLMLMVGGSPVAGFNDPQCGTSMPLGPSTPSVGVELSTGGFGSDGMAGAGTPSRAPSRFRQVGPPVSRPKGPDRAIAASILPLAAPCGAQATAARANSRFTL